MDFNFIEKHDNMMTDLNDAAIMSMLFDQIEEPGGSVSDYFKPMMSRLNKDERAGLSIRIANALEKTFNITFDDESKEDDRLVYNIYRLLVINLFSGFMIFSSQYIFEYAKKKSFLKTYSHIKPSKPIRTLTKENYIVISNLANIISDIMNLDITLETYLEYLEKGSDNTFSSYIKDLLDDGVISESGTVKTIYEIIKGIGMMDLVYTKIYMEYCKRYIPETYTLAFTSVSEEEELEESEYLED